MPNRLKIVPSRLLDALVRRDRRIPGRTSQIFAIFVWDVLALAVLIALGETEVNDVDAVTSSVSASDQEIVRLNIAMDDPLFMHLLDSLYQLSRDHQHRLQVEVCLLYTSPSPRD